MADKEYKNILIEREGGITFRSTGPTSATPRARICTSTWRTRSPVATDGDQGAHHRRQGEAWCAGQDLRLISAAPRTIPRCATRRTTPQLALEPLAIPEADHRAVHGYVRRRVHAALRCGFRDRGGRRHVRPVGGELGHHPGGLVSWNLPTCVAVAVMPSPATRRRQARSRSARQFRGAEGEATRGRSSSPKAGRLIQRRVLHQGGDPAVRHERQRPRLPETKQIARATQGNPRAARHEAVPTTNVSPGADRSSGSRTPDALR